MNEHHIDIGRVSDAKQAFDRIEEAIKEMARKGNLGDVYRRLGFVLMLGNRASGDMRGIQMLSLRAMNTEGLYAVALSKDCIVFESVRKNAKPDTDIALTMSGELDTPGLHKKIRAERRQHHSPEEEAEMISKMAEEYLLGAVRKGERNTIQLRVADSSGNYVMGILYFDEEMKYEQTEMIDDIAPKDLNDPRFMGDADIMIIRQLLGGLEGATDENNYIL